MPSQLGKKGTSASTDVSLLLCRITALRSALHGNPSKTDNALLSPTAQAHQQNTAAAAAYYSLPTVTPMDIVVAEREAYAQEESNLRHAVDRAFSGSSSASAGYCSHSAAASPCSCLTSAAQRARVKVTVLPTDPLLGPHCRVRAPPHQLMLRLKPQAGQNCSPAHGSVTNSATASSPSLIAAHSSDDSAGIPPRSSSSSPSTFISGSQDARKRFYNLQFAARAARQQERYRAQREHLVCVQGPAQALLRSTLPSYACMDGAPRLMDTDLHLPSASSRVRGVVVDSGIMLV